MTQLYRYKRSEAVVTGPGTEEQECASLSKQKFTAAGSQLLSLKTSINPSLEPGVRTSMTGSVQFIFIQTSLHCKPCLHLHEERGRQYKYCTTTCCSSNTVVVVQGGKQGLCR